MFTHGANVSARRRGYVPVDLLARKVSRFPCPTSTLLTHDFPPARHDPQHLDPWLAARVPDLTSTRAYSSLNGSACSGALNRKWDGRERLRAGKISSMITMLLIVILILIAVLVPAGVFQARKAREMERLRLRQESQDGLDEYIQRWGRSPYSEN